MILLLAAAVLVPVFWWYPGRPPWRELWRRLRA